MIADNVVVTLPNPFDPSLRRIRPLSFTPGRSVGEAAVLSGLRIPEAIVLRNGQAAALDAILLPGDVVHVAPRLDDDFAKALGMVAVAVMAYYIGPAAAGWLGLAGDAAEVFGYVATMATITAGGMLINSVAGVPAISGSRYKEQSESPTYGWGAGQNTAQEGLAIPVIVGNVATWPQIINRWMYIDNNSGDQWLHTLLSVGNGTTNNVPTADDISIDGQPITILPEDSYEISTTDGGINPTGALTHHDKLHQLRVVNKELVTATLSQILLHCNGEDGSTDIIDDAVGVADDPDMTGDTEHVNAWTCQGDAHLNTAHPFIGTAALDLETTGSYIDCDEPLAMDIWTKDAWDFECRFRQDVLTDSAIIGQAWTGGTCDYFWGIFYKGGQLVFQQYRDCSGTYRVYFNVSAAVTLSVDTWHHIRVAREDTTIYLFVDGVRVGSGAHSVDPVTAASASVISTVGLAYYYNGSSHGEIYGNCEIDELRLYAYGNLYKLSGFTPPTNALANDGEQAFFTKGVVDSFTVIVQCPYGLYKANPDGSIENGQVGLWVSFRKVGATAWVRYFVDVWTASRNPVTRQFPFTPAAGRGKYEIRVSRLHWWNAEEFGYENLFQTTCYFMWVDEVLHESLTYPGLQTVAVSVKAQEKVSGRFPIFRVVSNRTQAVVPDYDGSGTRTVDLTNNANFAFDAFTNRVYGLGLDPQRFIEADWEDWKDWCDGLVDGNPRCRINMAFDERMDMDEAMQNVEMCGRARIVPRGTQISVIVDKPRTANGLFCPTNTTPGTNHTRGIRKKERSDAVWISFLDKDLDFGENTAKWFSSEYNGLTRVARINKIFMRGINNMDQALREAIFRGQKSESCKLANSFQTGIEGIQIIPGDVYNYAHIGSPHSFAGRIARGSSREETYAGTTVYLDREITLGSDVFSGDCILIVRDPDDTVRQFSVTGPFDSATMEVTLASTGTFHYLSPYAIVTASGGPFQFQTDTITRSKEKDVLVEGRQYVEASFYNSEFDGGGTPI